MQKVGTEFFFEAFLFPSFIISNITLTLKLSEGKQKETVIPLNISALTY